VLRIKSYYVLTLNLRAKNENHHPLKLLTGYPDLSMSKFIEDPNTKEMSVTSFWAIYVSFIA